MNISSVIVKWHNETELIFTEIKNIYFTNKLKNSLPFID